MHRWHQGVPAVLAVLLLVPAAADVARAQESPVVAEIEFRGNKRTSTDTLLLSLRTKKGQRLDPALLAEDINTLYQFFEKVEPKEERTESGGNRLVFTVVENPPVLAVIVTGTDGIGETEVRSAIETSAGRPLAEFRVVNDQRKIERLYKSRGYHFAQVAPRIEDQNGGKRVVFEVLEGPEVTIEDISFKGNDSLPKDKLLERVAMRESRLLGLIPGQYVEETVRQDLLQIRNLYRSQGWLDAQVELDDVRFSEDKSNAFVSVRVVEGPAYTVGNVTIDGARSYPGGVAALLALLTIKTGDRDAEEPRYRAAEILERAYRDEGFFAVVVNAEPKLRPNAPVRDVVFHVEEASKVRVRALSIAGNVVTQDKVIRREIPLAPGDTLNQNAVDKGRRKLLSLGYFDRVTARVDPPAEGDDPNQRDLTFEVDDTATTGSVSFGVSVNSDTGLAASVRLTKRNFDWQDWPERCGDIFRGHAFTGAGETFRLDMSPGTDYSEYRLGYSQPWLFDKPISFGWDVFLTEFERFDYDQEASGIDFFLGRRWTFEGREIDTVYGIQGRTRIESLSVDNLDIESPPTAFLSEGSASLISEEFTFRISRLDSDGAPTKGWYGEISTEFGFAGDVRLWKNSVEAKRFWTVHMNEDQRPHILSIGAKLSLAEPLGSSEEADPNLLEEDFVPLYESYFAGGSSTIRGFGYGGAGPHGQGDPFLARRKGETSAQRDRRLANTARSILEGDGDPMGGNVQLLTSAEYTFPMYEDVVRGVLFCDAGMVRHSFGSAHGMEEDDFAGLDPSLLGGVRFDDGDSFFSDMRIALGFGIRLRIPALGPAPLALDFGFPLRKQDGDDTQVVSFSIRRDF